MNFFTQCLRHDISGKFSGDREDILSGDFEAKCLTMVFDNGIQLFNDDQLFNL